MNLLLIKIGKAYAAIKRDGIFRASRRIFSGIKTALRPVGSGDILFISGGVGDSALYRTTHVAEELQLNGFRCAVTVQDNPFLIKYVDRFSVFVFRRVTMTLRVRDMTTQIKKQGKEVIFETDDLVFDARTFKKTDAYALLNALEKKQYVHGIGGEILRDPYVKIATTTTGFLADKLHDEGKEVFIVPNKLSQQDVHDAQKAISHVQKDPKVVRLGYFSGTISHNKDFATITDALVHVMEKYPHVQLLLVGPLDVESVLVQRFRERIVQLPYVPRSQHFANIAQCDINLAPLVLEDPFCEAKSELKFFEAGIVNVPTVAVANRTFSEAIHDGYNGFLARDVEEWVQKISLLVEDVDLREQIGKGAHDAVLQHYVTTCAGNVTFMTHLYKEVHNVKDMIDRGSRLQDVQTAIVIVNWNGKEHLAHCFDSLRDQTDQDFSVIFVDNGSQDGSVDLVSQNYDNVSIISLGKNTGFAYANNIGIQYAFFHKNIRNIITLNNDTKLNERYIEHMHRALADHKNEKIGAIQPKLYNFFAEKMIDSVGVVTSFELSAHNRGRNELDKGQYAKQEYVFGPSASASLYTRDMLEDVCLAPGEYFDNAHFAYYEDVDLAWRLHLVGYKTLFVPQAIVYHVHSATGQNYSSFKSFHIHRNHYYNIIKNASFWRLIGIMLFMPLRYGMLVSSVLVKKGPAAAAKKKNAGDSLVCVVIRSWKDIIRHSVMMCKKRRIVQKKRTISSVELRQIFRNHHVSIKDVIYKQYK